MYLAIEGVDCVGKTTQIQLLQNAYPDALLTKEPGGSPLGVRLREMLLGPHDYTSRAEMFLFLADRAEHVERTLLPNRGKMIVSDRSLVSGIAYADPSFELSLLAEMNRFATGGLLPDKVVVIAIDEEELTRRLGAKHNDVIESRGVAYLLETQARIVKAAELLGIKTRVVDAKESKEAIFARIKEFLDD